jgi:hypothetical protein
LFDTYFPKVSKNIYSHNSLIPTTSPQDQDVRKKIRTMPLLEFVLALSVLLLDLLLPTVLKIDQTGLVFMVFLQNRSVFNKN